MTFGTLTSLGREQPLSLPRALSFDTMYTRTAAQNNLAGLPPCTVQLSSGHMPGSISMYSNCGLPLLADHTAASSPAANYGVQQTLAQQSNSSSGCLTDMQVSPVLIAGHVQAPVPSASASLAQAMLFESQNSSSRFSEMCGMPAAEMLQAPAAETSLSARNPGLPASLSSPPHHRDRHVASQRPQAAAAGCDAQLLTEALGVVPSKQTQHAPEMRYGSKAWQQARMPRQGLPAAALQYDAAEMQLDSKAWGAMPMQGCQGEAAALRHETPRMQLDSKAWARELVAEMQPASELSSPAHRASLAVAHHTGKRHAADTAAGSVADYVEQSMVLDRSTGVGASQMGIGAAQTAGHVAAEKMVATQ